ncbi:hypothetical protein Q8A73_019712 [Channa argus]|nr:hypothetical protein Q8A73_019712 [Channa argus]
MSINLQESCESDFLQMLTLVGHLSVSRWLADISRIKPARRRMISPLCLYLLRTCTLTHAHTHFIPPLFHAHAHFRERRVQRKESADGQRASEREREVVRSQLRDFPSASVAHRASYCMDVLHVTCSSAAFDWLFDAFGPIVWPHRRGFNRSGGGDRLQTYKKVFGNSKGLCRETPPYLSQCEYVNIVIDAALSLGLREPAKGDREQQAKPESRLALSARCWDAGTRVVEDLKVLMQDHVEPILTKEATGL